MEELLEACKASLRADDVTGHSLLAKVEQIYNKASKAYVESIEFRNRVADVIDQVKTNPKKMWVVTKDLFQELKAYKALKLTVADSKSNLEIIANPSENNTDAGQIEEGSEIGSAVDQKLSKKKVSENQIRRLEELLQAHSKEIERLEEAELSLDDLDQEDNSYLIAERLKKRAAKIFKRLCVLKNRSVDMGGLREKKFTYSGSRYRELNIHIQRFINKHSLEEKMPDYHDVRRIVKKCNLKYNYSLNQRRVDELSKEVFTDVGDALSVTRKKDFLEDFGPSYVQKVIKQPSDDPAMLSSNLREKLKENKKVAEINIRTVLDKFSEEQVKEMDARLEKQKSNVDKNGGIESEEEKNTKDTADDEDIDEESSDSDASSSDTDMTETDCVAAADDDKEEVKSITELVSENKGGLGASVDEDDSDACSDDSDADDDNGDLDDLSESSGSDDETAGCNASMSHSTVKDGDNKSEGCNEQNEETMKPANKSDSEGEAGDNESQEDEGNHLVTKIGIKRLAEVPISVPVKLIKNEIKSPEVIILSDSD